MPKWGRVLSASEVVRANVLPVPLKAQVTEPQATASRKTSRVLPPDSAAACQLDRTASALDSLELQQKPSLENEQAIVELGKLLASRLIGAELELSPEVIAQVAQSVLQEARGARRLQVRCSAVDASVLKAVESRLAEHFQAEMSISVDDNLGAGDLIVDSELGQIDARMNTRLDYLIERIR